MSIFDTFKSNTTSSKKDSCSDFLYPIFNGKGGYGFLANSYFYTAAHVLGKDSYIKNRQGVKLDINSTNSIFLSNQNNPKEKNYNDLAVFDLGISNYSPIEPYTEQCCKDMTVEVLRVEEGQQRIVKRIKGVIIRIGEDLGNENFIECLLEESVSGGDSGCPLFVNNQLVAVLTGDINGKESSKKALFQLIDPLT